MKQAIISCLNQDFPIHEIVVSDDHSTEDLYSIVNAFGDARLKYTRCSRNIGATRNHIKAVELSTGEYVLVLNSDDLLMPGAISEAYKNLDQTRSSAVYFKLAIFEGNQVLHASSVPSNVTKTSELDLSAKKELYSFTGGAPSSCLFRRDIFNSIGGYNKNLHFAYDWYLYLKFLETKNGVSFLPKVLGLYRKHITQMTQTETINGLNDLFVINRISGTKYVNNKDLATHLYNEIQISLKLRDKSKFLSAICLPRRHKKMLDIIKSMPETLLAKLKARLFAKENAIKNVNFCRNREEERKQLDAAQQFLLDTLNSHV